MDTRTERLTEQIRELMFGILEERIDNLTDEIEELEFQLGE